MSTPSLPKRIKSFLLGGPKHLSEIHEGVKGKRKSIDQAVRRMASAGDILENSPKVFCLPDAGNVSSVVPDASTEVENLRGEAENTETINKLLNLYDKLLDTVAVSIEDEDWKGVVEKIEAIKSLRWLGATVDQLMKRWYLVHRGYDTNTRQAVEDAKHKTADREQQEIENAPPEKQLKVIREYNESMREILENVPHTAKKENTV